MTPLLSQSGYEGLVAELHGIKSGMVEYVNHEQNKVCSVLSSKTDSVIPTLRMLNFSEAEKYLKKALIEIQEHYKKEISI